MVEINGEQQRSLRVFPWPAGFVMDEPCGFIPEEGIADFWKALGVSDSWAREEELQKEWMKGNMVLAAPEFPVLSALIQMQMDSSQVKAEDVPALLREVEIGRADCNDLLGIAVFEALKTCATVALSKSSGLLVSPF